MDIAVWMYVDVAVDELLMAVANESAEFIEETRDILDPEGKGYASQVEMQLDEVDVVELFDNETWVQILTMLDDDELAAAGYTRNGPAAAGPQPWPDLPARVLRVSSESVLLSCHEDEQFHLLYAGLDPSDDSVEVHLPAEPVLDGLACGGWEVVLPALSEQVLSAAGLVRCGGAVAS